MVTSCDAEASEEVVYNCPQSSLPLERCESSSDAANQGDAANEGDIEPVDVLVPILPGHGGVGDVRLVWIVF